MSEPDSSFDQRLEQAKLEAIKELAYGASHEVNNPLANISARAQTLLRDERDPDRRRALEAINHQALRAHEMISDLMLFARPPQLQLQSVELAPIARQLVEDLSLDCRRRQISIELDSAEGVPPVQGDPVQLSVAIKAILVNAVEAIGQKGSIDCCITVEYATGETSARVAQLAVQDSGPGIAPHVRPRIFDPFFSGREAGRGLGFGLCKAWRIVTDHGGKLTVDSPAHAGATFVIELPTVGSGG
jgi:signal transduction histidine kinase